MLPLFDASSLLLFAVELVPLLCTNFISVELFECYYGPLVRCIDSCWFYLQWDINRYYYYLLQQVGLLWIQTKTFHLAKFQPLRIRTKNIL